MTKKELQVKVAEIIDNTETLFRYKNDQYAATEDPLSNFTLGGELLSPGADTQAQQYEALKAYMAKHVAHIYGQPMDAKGIIASWQDIVVYGIIALAMLEVDGECTKM